MTFKALLFILFLIVAEIFQLLKEGIIEHKLTVEILKILILNTDFLTILTVKSFSFRILLKMMNILGIKILKK